MKGDFSRLTFNRQLHHARVLQQQGRPLLDADWNEQTAILLHRIETLTGDLTGACRARSGAPVEIAGFEICEIPGEEQDFRIGAGRYYVDGLCCENDAETSYLSQLLAVEEQLDPEGVSLIYLEAWEAVVTALDEPTLAEPALNGLDTTLRTRIVWRTRAARLTHAHKRGCPASEELHEEARQFAEARRTHPRGLLRARLGPVKRKSTEGAAPVREPSERGHFRGPENLLYRVEIHTGGPEGQATFKWSRENGGPLLPLTKAPDGKIVHIAASARQALRSLAPGAWVEPSDSRDRLGSRARPMTQVVNVDAASGRVELHDAPQGSFGAGAALRRWDQRTQPGGGPATIGPNGAPIVEGEHDAHWLDLEDGLQIQFLNEHGRPHHYLAGDYWLIPARISGGGTLLRAERAQEPDGVWRRFAPLALLAPRLGGLVHDLRPSFSPMAALQEQVNRLQDQVEGLYAEIAELRAGKR
jgi:hypothetical protein